MDNVMEAYNWQLAQMWLEGTVKGIKPGKVYAVNNIVGYGRNETFEMIADYFILNEQKAVLYMCSNCGKKKMENNISERFKTHMYERAFSSDTEDSEKTFEDDCSCECFITDIINKFNIGAPTISHHLKELSNAGLIITEKRGKFLIAKINKEVISEACSIINNNKKK